VAVEYYDKGCRGGSATSCFMLGVSYETGVGVPADPTYATELYRLACDGGNTDVCNQL
jgi:TPR repeat protein